MTRLGLAMRVFFRVLRDAAFARQVQQIMKGKVEAAVVTREEKPVTAARSGALSLLEALQREARFVDFMKESLGDYSDAQVGAAVRDVHRGCAQTLERMFALRPVMEQAEGTSVTLSGGFDAASVRLTGNVSGGPPFKGVLRHQGWQATKIELPEWSGSAESARVVAPAEVEL